MSTNYTPQQVAQFISEYTTNEDVKKELKKYGYSIVPNKLSLLLENIEKIGYKVLKTQEYEELKSKAEMAVSEPELPSEHQILGGFPDTSVTESKTKELIDPFSDTPLIANLETKEQVAEQAAPKEEVKPKVEEFTHVVPPKEVPEDPLLKLWFKLKERVKEVHSISMYSLIVNAQAVSLENDTLTVGFTTKHTYQMNQFKRKDNRNKFLETLKEVSGQNYDIICEVITDKTETTPVKTETVPSTEVFQILGGQLSGEGVK